LGYEDQAVLLEVIERVGVLRLEITLVFPVLLSGTTLGFGPSLCAVYLEENSSNSRWFRDEWDRF
jgi:hypothetical protein